MCEIRPHDELPMGKVEFGGIVKDVCLSYTPEAEMGDYVLVHVGFAISRMDEAEARGAVELIEQIEGGGIVLQLRPKRKMKFLDEYRDAEAVRRLAAAIRETTTRPWNIMEMCGGQTHAILRFGLDELLPQEITLIHGPGCPVCVTPIELIDKAGGHRRPKPEVIFCSFGDMLRVPGSARIFSPSSRRAGTCGWSTRRSMR